MIIISLHSMIDLWIKILIKKHIRLENEDRRETSNNCSVLGARDVRIVQFPP